jgi:hypothetical protein
MRPPRETEVSRFCGFPGRLDKPRELIHPGRSAKGHGILAVEIPSWGICKRFAKVFSFCVPNLADIPTTRMEHQILGPLELILKPFLEITVCGGKAPSPRKV